jgi:hypothetical protein
MNVEEGKEGEFHVKVPAKNLFSLHYVTSGIKKFDILLWEVSTVP